MTQKVLKVGSSAAVTIPKDIMKKLGLKIGDRVNVGLNEEKKRVSIEPVAVIDNDTVDWTRKFIDKYRDALEELAEK